MAVDGSFINLPNTEQLAATYGLSKNQYNTGIVQARVSILYDVLNEFVLDGLLKPRQNGERALAMQQLQYCKSNDLIIYDRGYPSFELMHEHYQKDLDFLFRVKTSFSDTTNEFINSNKKSSLVEIFPGKNAKLTNKSYDKNTSIKVRLLRIKLPSGETELLMTSLLDIKKFPNRIFKDLYFKRWRIETYYDELKNKLKVEHFSGYSHRSIQQDFNAALFISNVQTLIVSELSDEIKEKTGKRKYEYKVNKNLLYGFLKNRVVTLFYTTKDIAQIVRELKDLFKQHLEPVRLKRNNPRDTHKYRRRRKPIITFNQKDSV